MGDYLNVITLEVPELGNRSYLVHDGTVAVVIDPSRRIQQLITAAAKAGVTIQAVFETHIHNDYVTGGYALAQQLGVPYYVSKQDQVQFEHVAAVPEAVIPIGRLTITPLASAGHTHHHLSYLVEQPGVAPALFSGGSLLYGAVGRTDLISAQDTSALARAQYQTAQFFADRLDPATRLYPTHGFGSFCAATETEKVDVSTIGQQLHSNQAYTAPDEASFVATLLSNLEAYPSYYVYMAPANLKGPLEPQLKAPVLLTKAALMRAIHTGAAIIDLRSRLAYAAKHLPGTYNIESSNDLATYVGWLLRWDEPLIVVAATAAAVATAHEQLSLIGREQVIGQARPPELLQTATTAFYPVRNFVDLAAVITSATIAVIDVRRRSEWRKSHIASAVHIPLPELPDRLAEFSDDTELWVHCASGFRASIATSLISGSGKPAVLINDRYANAAKAGIATIEGTA